MIKCDVETTVTNVKDFFKYDFWHYINLGGIHVNQLSSPQMSLTGTSHSNTNGVEKSLISDLSEAEQATYRAETIAIALNNCSDLDKLRKCFEDSCYQVKRVPFYGVVGKPEEN